MNAKQEELELSRVRNVGMDVQAIMHMQASYKTGEKEWTCRCVACNYVRQSPRVVDAFARTIVRNSK